MSARLCASAFEPSPHRGDNPNEGTKTMTQKPSQLTQADLRQFTGTETWYRHSFKNTILYTDGAKYVADTAGAYWLIDEIVFAQLEQSIAAATFQLWKLKVHANHTATLTCENGNCTVIHTKHLTFTDFPLEEISFYFTDNVILLPSEY